MNHQNHRKNRKTNLMPKPNSNGPRRRKSDDKPQGARPGGRTRENRSDASGSKRPTPFKKGKSENPSNRSDKPPRREGKPGAKDSGGPSRYAAKPFGSKRPSRQEGNEQRDFRKPRGGDQDADRPRTFGSKRPARQEGNERRDFRKSTTGEHGNRSNTRGSDRGGDRFKGTGGDRARPGKFDRDSFDRAPPRGEGKKSSFGKPDHGEQSEDRRPFKKFDRTGVKRGGQKIREEQEQPASTPSVGGPVRLNKFIANSGVCSRREADQLITMGLISVNGKVVTTLGHKVNPGDEVRHEDRVLRAEKPVYILMNKPKGFLTTTSDPQERNTVMNLVGGIVKERVYPVGRLDRNTTGLLVLTNDGDLADKLMHPSHNVKKIYRVELDRPLTKADATKIMEGIHLEEGRAMVDDLAVVSEDKKTVGLEIHIGWNRVVRRIFEALGYQVVKLDRTMYAGLTKKDLPRGEWRFLKKEEIVLLKHFK